MEAALQANDSLSPVSKTQYTARLAALQRMTGQDRLEDVLLQPSQALKVLRQQVNASTGRPLADSSVKAYVAAVLATLKHVPQLHRRAYRRARRHWVQAFKRLHAVCDQHTSMCATGEALPSRVAGYLPWQQICKVRDKLPMGSIERVLLELHTHAIGRSREYAAVRIFDAAPSRDQRRAHPNHIVLHPSDPARSYLRLGSYKTSRHLGAYKVVLSPTLHKAIVASLRQQPRQYLFEPPTAPGHPFLPNTYNHWARRRFQAVFGRPLTSNSIRHAYANTLDLNNMTHDQLQAAARRMGHVNDSLARMYVWGALKTPAATLNAQQQGTAQHQPGPAPHSQALKARGKRRQQQAAAIGQQAPSRAPT